MDKIHRHTLYQEHMCTEETLGREDVGYSYSASPTKFYFKLTFCGLAMVGELSTQVLEAWFPDVERWWSL
jgi:hypothetical protein